MGNRNWQRRTSARGKGGCLPSLLMLALGLFRR